MIDVPVTIVRKFWVCRVTRTAWEFFAIGYTLIEYARIAWNITRIVI